MVNWENEARAPEGRRARFDYLSSGAQKRVVAYWDQSQAAGKDVLNQIEKEEGKPKPRDLRSNLTEANDLF